MAKKRVLVQAGHIAPREPGPFEGQTGTIREQEFTRKIRDRLVAYLEEDGRFDPIPVPGDIPDGIKCDAAIFEHADGSANHEARGTSFGFPEDETNEKLARHIRTRYQQIPGHPPRHADNYTGDLRGYYGFRRVDTAGPEVLVESGFMTNPAEQTWLFAHISQLAYAQYLALLDYFDMELPGDETTWHPGMALWAHVPGAPVPLPPWVYPFLKEYERRRALT